MPADQPAPARAGSTEPTGPLRLHFLDGLRGFLMVIGVPYHPEYRSRPFAPHPLFASFIAAALVQSRLV